MSIDSLIHSLTHSLISFLINDRLSSRISGVSADRGGRRGLARQAQASLGVVAFAVAAAGQHRHQHRQLFGEGGLVIVPSARPICGRSSCAREPRLRDASAQSRHRGRARMAVVPRRAARGTGDSRPHSCECDCRRHQNLIREAVQLRERGQRYQRHLP